MDQALNKIVRLCLLALAFTSCAALPSREGQRGLFQGKNPAFDRSSPEDQQSCSPLTDSDRLRLLEVAQPVNFPATRYRKRPNLRKSIESETDCSHFVHEVYRRAGLPYGFRGTNELSQAEEFELLPESQAQAGDLMLFRGHVGIVDADGRIISALVTRHRRRKSSIAKMDRVHFRTFRGQRNVLRYRCQPATLSRSVASKGKNE